MLYNCSMQGVWDYDEGELQKTEKGKILLLERMINYGPGKKKIKLSEVKKYWDKLDLFPPQRKLFELLLWDTTQSLPKIKKSFWMK